MNESLLKKHLQWTPRMAPTDAVKLAYQSAFGCGHLLSAREICADFVRREMESTSVWDVPACVSIGGGLCRLNLASAQVRNLSPECIADMMILTNGWVMERLDNAQRFEESLSLIGRMAEAGEMPFSADEYQTYLSGYRAQGCPPVSHSEMYRGAYHPAYRVVRSDFAALLPVMERLGQTGVCIIDGPCGSGKTTLAGMMARLYGTKPIPMDDFFLPFDMRTEERFSQPGGNVHHERFKEEILAHIQVGEPLAYQRFDCQSGALVPREHAASSVVIIEGSYSHHPAFAEHLKRLNALRVYVDVDPVEQLRRIALRNPEMLSMFQTRWIPLEKTYFEAYDIKDRADLVIRSQPWNA